MVLKHITVVTSLTSNKPPTRQVSKLIVIVLYRDRGKMHQADQNGTNQFKSIGLSLMPPKKEEIYGKTVSEAPRYGR